LDVDINVIQEVLVFLVGDKRIPTIYDVKAVAKEVSARLVADIKLKCVGQCLICLCCGTSFNLDLYLLSTCNLLVNLMRAEVGGDFF
jgi:hypothetical protein